MKENHLDGKFGPRAREVLSEERLVILRAHVSLELCSRLPLVLIFSISGPFDPELEDFASASIAMLAKGLNAIEISPVDDFRSGWGLILWSVREIPGSILVCFQVRDVDNRVDFESLGQLQPVSYR